MKIIPLFLIAIIFSLFQSTINLPNFLLAFLIFVSFYFEGKIVFSLAIFSGLILDFLTLGHFNLSAILFLIVVLLIFTYRQRFSYRNPILLFLMVFISSVIFSFISFRIFGFINALILSVVSIFIQFVLTNFYRGKEISLQ